MWGCNPTYLVPSAGTSRYQRWAKRMEEERRSGCSLTCLLTTMLVIHYLLAYRLPGWKSVRLLEEHKSECSLIDRAENAWGTLRRLVLVQRMSHKLGQLWLYHPDRSEQCSPSDHQVAGYQHNFLIPKKQLT
jgi:hypothetical protein